MRVLVKLGGTLLDEGESRNRIARELAGLSAAHEVVIVHGGGKQVTRDLERQGIESRFAGGLRISDEQVLESVTRVIAGGVNKQLVAALVSAGCPAVGLSGVDGALTIAERVSDELGWVGRPLETRADLLYVLVEAGYLPVLACIAGDQAGHIYNVNADQMAVSCAIGWGAKALIFLTDVPGVRKVDGTVAQELTAGDVAELIQSGVAHGGMQAKLEAAQLALKNGVAQVTIAPGHQALGCERILAGQSIGTRIVSADRELAGGDGNWR